jgi:hypothetical protein
MSLIVRKLEFVGSKSEAEIETLFDSGSSYSCIKPELANQLGVVVPLPRPFTVETAAKGQTLDVSNSVDLLFRVKGLDLNEQFMVIPNLSEDAIIGAKTMQAWRIKLDFENDDVIVDPRVAG